LNYFTRNKTKQNILGVIAGAIAFAASIGLSMIMYTNDSAANEIINMFMYLLIVTLAGIITGVICFRKNGFLITVILALLSMLGTFIWYVIDFYNTTIPNPTTSLSEVLFLLKFGPGLLFALLGCYLGVYIKFKKQKGANFDLPVIKEDS